MINIRRSIKTLSLSLALTLVSGIAQADEPTGHYTQYKLKVKSVASIATGAYIYFDTNHQCGAKRAFIPRSSANFKEMYNTLTFAYASGQLVSADLRGACSGIHSNINNLCVGDADSPCFTGW